MNGPAQLGYFEKNQNADDACVLVVSYEFKDTLNRRHGNEKDLENLRKSFKENRNCGYKELASPTAEDFLEILKNEGELLQLFKISSVPSVFLLIILSHGKENNIIETDHKDQNGKSKYFLTTEVVEAIQKSPNLREQLNVIFFGSCRGKLEDVAHQEMEKPENYKNQTSSRLTNMPDAKNFVVVYSTVETTLSNRDRIEGTWLVQGICTLLDNLQKDEPLAVFLTKLQHWIHGKLDGFGQTPEVKYTRHRKFVISKSVVKRAQTAVVRKTDSDGIGGNRENIVTAERSAFFQWRTENGTNLRRKWAMIISNNKKSSPVSHFEKALRENLGFETHTSEQLDDVFKRTQGEQSNVGCFLAVFYAPLSLDEKTEICVRFGGTSRKIGDVVYKFLGPENRMWIGRPKLFFFVNTTKDLDNSQTAVEKFNLPGTNHSGSFICILNSKDSAEKLIHLFENFQLKTGTSIQELALDLLDRIDPDNSENVINQIVSTLPFLVDVPIRPITFVAPALIVISNKISKFDGEKESHTEVRASSSASGRNRSKFPERQETNEKNLTFDELKREMKQILLGSGEEDYCVWLFSSLPGSGKSTILLEIASCLNREQTDKKIFNIQLQKHYGYFHSERDPNIVKFLSRSSEGLDDVKKLIGERKLIVFLDGYDEICPDLRAKVMKIIKDATEKKIPLVIATRPEEEETLFKSLDRLATKKIVIKPLAREEQLKLLINLGKNKEDCEELFNLFETSNATDILKNPFHLTLISGVKLESVQGIFGIYEVVIKKKVTDALQTSKESRRPADFVVDKRIQLLQDISLRFLLNDSSIPMPTEIDLINNTGVASLEKETIQFVHQTFAEFLVAQRFIQEIEKKSASSIPIFENTKLRQCRFFINSCISQNATFRENLSIFFDQSQNVDIHSILSEQLDRIFHELQPKIKRLLNSSDVNKRDTNKITLLLVAARFSSEEICRFLVENGADLSAVDEDGDDALHCACLGGKLDNAKYLLGLNGFSVVKKGWNGRSALHRAAENGHVGVAKFLLSKGANVNARDDDNRTPLNLAALFSSEEMCRFMVENGADVSAVDKDGDDALHLACHFLRMDNAKCLLGLDGFSVEKKGHLGRTVLHRAAINGFVLVAEFLLRNGANVNARDDDNRTPLTLAASFSSEEMCRFLVGKDADLKAVDKDGEDALHCACHEGKLDNAKYLLGLKFFSVEKKGYLGRTALFWASKKGHVAVAEFLLSKGANVNARDNGNETPLTLAASFSSEEMCRFLIENGADLSAVDKDGDDAFHWACLGGKLDNAKYLLGLKFFSVEKKCNLGRTALHKAAQKGHVTVAEFLLSKGANVNARDDKNNTPLALAAGFSSEEMCRFLVGKDADLSAVDKYGSDALHCACLNGKLDNAKYLLGLKFFSVEKKGYFGRTALYWASKKGNVAVAEFLVSKGANVNARDDDNRTPLTLAAQYSSEEICRFLVENGTDLNAVDTDGHDAFHWACLGGKLDNAKYLLRLNGFSVEKKGWNGRSALHRAAQKGHVAVAGFLLSKGANVNARDDDNRTPLTLAASFSSEEMCRFLVGKDANLSAVDAFGNDALHCACHEGKLDNAKYLLGLNGFSVEKKGWNGISALHFAANGHVAVAEFLLLKGANVNARDDDNNTPLALAARFSSEEMCRFLVGKGADLSAVDKDGDDALHLACLNGKLDNAKYLLGLNGFSVEKKGRWGRTALHGAAQKGHVAVAEFLLSKGANVNARDDGNETPLTLAFKFSNDETCQILMKYGGIKPAPADFR